MLAAGRSLSNVSSPRIVARACSIPSTGRRTLASISRVPREDAAGVQATPGECWECIFDAVLVSVWWVCIWCSPLGSCLKNSRILYVDCTHEWWMTPFVHSFLAKLCYRDGRQIHAYDGGRPQHRWYDNGLYSSRLHCETRPGAILLNPYACSCIHI